MLVFPNSDDCFFLRIIRSCVLRQLVFYILFFTSCSLHLVFYILFFTSCSFEGRLAYISFDSRTTHADMMLSFSIAKHEFNQGRHDFNSFNHCTKFDIPDKHLRHQKSVYQIDRQCKWLRFNIYNIYGCKNETVFSVIILLNEND